MAIKLATCTYQEFRPYMGIPVRTTYGPPRFELDYPLVHTLPEITPLGWMLGLEYAPYRKAYFELLESAGVESIRMGAQRIANGANQHEPQLVLLCFDVLTKPGAWCHRRLFAEWWRVRADQEVPELGAQPPSGPQPEQDELF